MAHKPAVRNCWAPEIVYDEETGEFVIFWASTIPGAFPETAGSSEDAYNHRMYATTTRDFEVFTPTRLFYEPGFSVIDAAFLRAADGSLHWIVKDETVNPPRKHLRLAAAESVQGPFGELSAPFTPEGLCEVASENWTGGIVNHKPEKRSKICQRKTAVNSVPSSKPR